MQDLGLEMRWTGTLTRMMNKFIRVFNSFGLHRWVILDVVTSSWSWWVCLQILPDSNKCINSSKSDDFSKVCVMLCCAVWDIGLTLIPFFFCRGDSGRSDHRFACCGPHRERKHLSIFDYETNCSGGFIDMINFKLMIWFVSTGFSCIKSYKLEG